MSGAAPQTGDDPPAQDAEGPPPAGRNAPRPWPSTLYTREDLQPYRKFRVLYGERKFAREFPDQKQTLSFTEDLPPEIRLMVYDYLPLQAPGRFFELGSPTAWHSTGDDRDRAHERDRDETPIKNAFSQYASMRKALSLMRLCKTVHDELTEVFYSKQNFRFSHTNGVVMLGAWMHTINTPHFQYLRHITVQIPMRDASEWCIQSQDEWKSFQRVVKKRGMRMARLGTRRKNPLEGHLYGDFCYQKTVKKAFGILKSMTGLRRLELSVPWNYPFLGSSSTQPRCERGYLDQFDPLERIRHVVEDHCSDEEWWGLLDQLKRESQSPDLKIALVLHHGWRDTAADEHVTHIQGQLRAARWLACYAQAKGYDFGHAHWEDGVYNIDYGRDPLLTLPPALDGDDSRLEPPEVPAGTELVSQSPRASEKECIEFGYSHQQECWPYNQAE